MTASYLVVYTSPTYKITLEAGRTDEVNGPSDTPDDVVLVGLPDRYLLTYNSPGWEGHSVGAFASLDAAMAEISAQGDHGRAIKDIGDQMLRDAMQS